MESIFYVLPLFFLTALVYASAGLGGGSTYLALLTLFGFSYGDIPKIALLCNLVVVAGGLYHYLRAGLLPFGKILPLVLTSIPLAYLGGRIPVSQELFLFLLAIALAAAGVRLLLTGEPLLKTKGISPRGLWITGLSSGGALGFLSGLVGIGGGIFLAPLLYFLGWGTGRQIAAAASFYIFVNSAAGLAGQFAKSDFSWPGGLVFPLLLAVFAGGQIGSRVSLGFLPLAGLRKITASLILFVSFRIFLGLL
ncbi:MAG: sulfite exporter TauE/SafE family protein [Deltaproteobacteria bacterium]|nr:sulfite exporter TauE/SafE family protein [Deltaproteobacteria bacterium]